MIRKRSLVTTKGTEPSIRYCIRYPVVLWNLLTSDTVLQELHIDVNSISRTHFV